MQRLQPSAISALRTRLKGDLHTDRLHRHLLATDGSIFEVTPAAVVYPADTADVVATVQTAHQFGLTLHARGAGSGLCGAALGRGIVLDFTRYMNRLVSLDTASRAFTCQPGYRLGELNAALNGSGLFFPPDPSSGEFATFGGMAATNASGAHSVKYGHVADYLVDAQIVTADGQCLRLTEITDIDPGKLTPAFSALRRLYLENADQIENGYPRVAANSSGYNLQGLVREGRLDLRRLLCGSEGTLAVTTELTFRLKPAPAADSLVVAYFDDSVAAAKAVQTLMPSNPAGIEMMDRSLLELARSSDKLLARRIPTGFDNLLLIEYDADDEPTVAGLARQALGAITAAGLSRRAHLAVSPVEKARFWAVRKAAVPILYRLKGDRKILALVEDAAVPIDGLVDYVRGLKAIMGRMRVAFVLYGHIAKGLIHTRPMLNLKDPADVAKLKPLADAVFELVSGLGGTISGEHGDGRLRSTYVRRQYPQLFSLMAEAKTILDPDNLLNPDIKTRSTPRQMQQNLRYGTGYRGLSMPPSLLSWPEGFTTAIEACHGCSKCTTVTTATRMCPVYKFTRLEAAAPKAKANVLRALVSGKLPSREVYAKTVQKVIRLCVGCGSCHRECPSHVNIPKMAMEAMGRYKRRFGPTLTDRCLANPEAAGRYLGPVAPLMNGLSRRSSVRNGAQQWAGLSRHRQPPQVARTHLFKQVPSLGRVPDTRKGRRRVLYFSGCYAGYIRPEIGLAAVRVLRRLGYQVAIPDQHCCGLPMIAKGLIVPARRKLKANKSKWRSLLPSVDHVVVTCSSCGLMLQQEWSYLDQDGFAGGVKAKLIHISRLVNQRRHRLKLTSQPLQAAYHMPCHLKVQPQADSSVAMLRGVPSVSVTVLDSHCCGMAGSWGMRADAYDLSVRIGTDLMDKLAASHADVALTDCPTCRMQMEDLGDIAVRHPIEVVAAGMMATADEHPVPNVKRSTPNIKT